MHVAPIFRRRSWDEAQATFLELRLTRARTSIGIVPLESKRKHTATSWSMLRNALRSARGLWLINVKTVLRFSFLLKKAQQRLKRTCIDFTLISLYVKHFEGDQVGRVLYFINQDTPASDPSRRVSLGDTLRTVQGFHKGPRLGANSEKSQSKDDSNKHQLWKQK